MLLYKGGERECKKTKYITTLDEYSFEPEKVISTPFFSDEDCRGLTVTEKHNLYREHVLRVTGGRHKHKKRGENE